MLSHSWDFAKLKNVLDFDAFGNTIFADNMRLIFLFIIQASGGVLSGSIVANVCHYFQISHRGFI